MEQGGSPARIVHQGSIYAMTGGSLRHSFIATNICGSLYTQLRGKKCTVYSSELRIKVETTGLYTYPDASVVCEPVQSEQHRQDTVINPTVIIEVLSPGTKDYDQGTKMRHYRTIASLHDYLVIAQDAIFIEHHRRQADHQWKITRFTSPELIVRLGTIACTLALKTIYEKVNFNE